MTTTITLSRIPTWLANIPDYMDKIWTTDNCGHLVCEGTIIRLRLQNDSSIYNHDSIVKIHNENLLLGITDAQYNESLTDS